MSKAGDYILPNHIEPNSFEATQQMIRVLQSEIASLRGVIDKLNARVTRLQAEIEGEQS